MRGLPLVPKRPVLLGLQSTIRYPFLQVLQTIRRDIGLTIVKTKSFSDIPHAL